jgi:serine/threonine protein kinase
MLDIVKGFHTLVKHKIIHRDLKSSNMFISKKGIKIGDFGFAYKTGDFSQTLNIPPAGSPLYMAPEVI